MIIQIDRIPWEGLDVVGELPAAILSLEVETERLRPIGPVVCRLHARIVAQEVLVRGSLKVPIEFACARCGEFFPVTVSEPGFEEVYPFSEPHETLDLTCDVRDSIILAFPSFPLCAETCRGVCRQCGANRNRTACSCKAVAWDERWKVLDGILPVRSNTDSRD